jgi:hypothetical protein
VCHFTALGELYYLISVAFRTRRLPRQVVDGYWIALDKIKTKYAALVSQARRLDSSTTIDMRLTCASMARRVRNDDYSSATYRD